MDDRSDTASAEYGPERHHRIAVFGHGHRVRIAGMTMSENR